MASLGDVLPVVREVGVWTLTRRVVKETLDDHVFVYASALSYAWLFAFFPMLVFLISLLPYLPVEAREAGQNLIFEAIRRNFPPETAHWILENTRLKMVIESTLNARRGAILSVSLVVALYAASNGISAIMTALDRCYDIDKGRPFYRSKPLSLLLTVVLTGLVLVVMTLIPVGSFIRNQIVAQGLRVPFTEIELKNWMVLVFDWARHAIGLTASFAILSIIYNFCPTVRMRWNLVSPGAVVCFVFWVAIGLGFKFYLAKTGGTTYSQTFGPAAGLAILLLMFYLYGVVLLVGAELNSEIDFVRLKVPPGTRDFLPYQRELARKEKEEKRLRERRREHPPHFPGSDSSFSSRSSASSGPPDSGLQK